MSAILCATCSSATHSNLEDAEARSSRATTTMQRAAADAAAAPFRRVLIAGGSGFLGRALGSALVRHHGSEVVVLSRNASADVDGRRVLTWDELQLTGLPRDVTSVVNLCGLNVMAKRWNDEGRRQM